MKNINENENFRLLNKVATTNKAELSYYQNFWLEHEAQQAPDHFYTVKYPSPDNRVFSTWLNVYFPDKRRILDLGCGNGRNTIFYAEQGFNASGVDISESALRIAYRHASEEKHNIELFLGDICSPIPTDMMNSFDIISDSGCFHHIRDREKYKVNLRKLLKHGGLFKLWCFSDRTKNFKNYYPFKNKGKLDNYFENQSKHITFFYNERKIRAVFNDFQLLCFGIDNNFLWKEKYADWEFLYFYFQVD